MSNFIVSARKYRPSKFDEVVGQQHISQTLKNAISSGHIAHAFLFCGPRGVGKTTNARILAKMLNCLAPTADHEACGTCASCTAFAENASFSIFELDAASNNGVEHIRALIEQVRIPPQVGKYKVFIIDEVHMLSAQAFNAFLKTLEEPPAHAIFILATTEKHKILPTILSRCQIFDFRRIGVQDIVNHLKSICKKENIEAEDDALHIIAQKSDGGLRDALSIFDRIVSFANGQKIQYATVIENLNVLDYDHYFQLTDALLAEDLPKTMLLFDQIQRKGFEADSFINGLAEHLRNILVCRDESTLALLEVSDNLRDRYRKQAALTPASFILTTLGICNDCDIHYKTARAKRLHVEMALIKMAYSTRALSVASGQWAVDSEEKKSPDVNGRAVEPPFISQKTAEPSRSQVVPARSADGENPRVESKISAPEGVSRIEFQAEMVANEPPKIPQSPIPSQPINQSSNSTKISFNLDAFEAEVIAEDAEKEARVSLFNLENATREWLLFAEIHESQVLRSNLKSAVLSIENGKLVASVGGDLAKSMIQQETGLSEFLRTNLHEPLLNLEIRVDEARAAANRPTAPQRKLLPQEIFEKMRETNPLVSELVRRFELKPVE